MSKILGIDVSEHNGKLNWKKLKAEGVDFAIIRTGYGSGTTDKQFHNNVKGCIANGIPFGVYHFSYALNKDKAQAEAEFVVKLLKSYKDKITLPVFYDFEYDTVNYAKKNGVALGKAEFNNFTVAFLEEVKKAGYKAGVYYNLDYLKNYADMSKVGKYVQWYAQYANSPSISDYDLWQYSSSRSIPGFTCNFDSNILKNESLLNKKQETKPVSKPENKTFKVKVAISNLNIRSGAGLKYKSVGFCPKGVYTIVDSKKADGYEWGKLKSGKGWIALKYTTRV